MSVRRTAAALLTAGLLLAGCSDDPEPRFEPTETPSPTETSSAAEPEAQSPEEFIRDWFEAGTDMQNSGETGTFLSLSDGCDACERFAADVEGVYKAGGFIRIKSEVVRRVEPVGGDAFEVTVVASPTTFRETAGSKPGSFPGGPNTYRVTVVERAGQWRVADYQDMS
jgi:hypothetical protein